MDWGEKDGVSVMWFVWSGSGGEDGQGQAYCVAVEVVW